MFLICLFFFVSMNFLGQSISPRTAGHSAKFLGMVMSSADSSLKSWQDDFSSSAVLAIMAIQRKRVNYDGCQEYGGFIFVTDICGKIDKVFLNMKIELLKNRGSHSQF